MSRVLRLGHLALAGDGPGPRLQGVGVLGGVGLAGAELVEVVVAGDVLEGRLLLVDRVGRPASRWAGRRTATPGPRRPAPAGARRAQGAQPGGDGGATTEKLPPAAVQPLGGDLALGDGFTQLLPALHVYRTFCHGAGRPAHDSGDQTDPRWAAQGISLPAGRATARPRHRAVRLQRALRGGGPRPAPRHGDPRALLAGPRLQRLPLARAFGGAPWPTTSTWPPRPPSRPAPSAGCDLALDVLVRPGAPPVVLDEDELPPTWIPPPAHRIEPPARAVLEQQPAVIADLEEPGRPRCGRASSGWARS